MIAKVANPDRPGETITVALHMERCPTWTPLSGHHEDDLSAARACAALISKTFQRVTLQARILRALCEHPEFEFSFVGIDADTIRDQARQVDDLIQTLVPNVEYLLDTPAPGDVIRIDGQRMDVLPGGLLEPRPDPDDDVDD